MAHAHMLAEGSLFVGVCLASLILWAYLEGQSARLFVLDTARWNVQCATDHANWMSEYRLRYTLAAASVARVSALRKADIELVDLFDAIGDEVGVFRCNGCDSHFIRNQPGFVAIGPFEFCSETCRQIDLPIPVLAKIANAVMADRTLN